ncbi:hypothetical protein GV794_10090 [Nocardia cyriacigeorgica]|uniref:Uncharacterized protein n=1 Tax=Nocardia cyriacigeorgica TaxID=135487 RepID=A0ABX0CHH4_9NOCA|nr:hypothetical protein [Nocardia cyriacigeorgica]NEW39216.1 hypothetical protein [Nocardia cyriacigeorgica]NEW49720.1 hypothetical protein [Nocardia cyriacigeorgica]NEW55999.1 hypothetical protein [Nocardia cyriacigeorgica]
MSARRRATASVGAPAEIQRATDAVVTGDIALWTRRTAVVVVFGSGSTRTLEVVVDGELRPFAAQMRYEQDEFGPFIGFRNPGSAELALPFGGRDSEPERGDPDVHDSRTHRDRAYAPTAATAPQVEVRDQTDADEEDTQKGQGNDGGTAMAVAG